MKEREYKKFFSEFSLKKSDDELLFHGAKKGLFFFLYFLDIFKCFFYIYVDYLWIIFQKKITFSLFVH